jgi:uroporphyrinogen-III synthase
MSTPASTAPLAGFTVAVTADRRRDELATLLERHGARVVVAPALSVVPVPEDPELHAATVSAVDKPPDLVVATSAAGLRGWLEAAEIWGLADALRRRLATAHLVFTRPAARRTGRRTPRGVGRDAGRGASRGTSLAVGLVAHWTPPSGGSDEVLDYVLARGVDRRRVAVQLDGEPLDDFGATLRDSGAEVLDVPVYRWGPPADPAPLRRLVDLIHGRLVDAVTFTSAPAVSSLLEAGGPDLVDRLRRGVTAACLGRLAAAPLTALGLPVVTPDRARLGGLAGTLAEVLPGRAPTLKAAGTTVTLRGHAAVVNGTLKPLAPAPMAVLRALAEARGAVLSRAALLRVLPNGADEHAVEMAVARLRAALGGTALVKTVVKRGYRLALD